MQERPEKFHNNSIEFTYLHIQLGIGIGRQFV